MPGWYGNRPQEDIEWSRSLERGRQRAAEAAAAWNASDAAYAARIARAANWMDPGVVLGLARAHASPRVVEMAAASSAAIRLAQKPNVPVGTTVRTENLTPGDRRLFSETMRDLQHSSNYSGPAYIDHSNPVQRQIYKLAQDAGITGEYGVIDLGDTDYSGQDENDPATFMRRNVVRQLIEAGVDRIPVVRNGRSGWVQPVGQVLENPRQAEQTGRRTLDIARRGDPVPEGYAISYGQPYRPPPTPDQGGLMGAIASAGEAASGALSAIRPDVVEEATRNTRIDLDQYRLPDPLGTQRVQSAGVAVTPTDLIRNANIAMNAPVQEFQGVIRNIYGQAHGRPVDWWEPQSDLGVMLGTGADPGNGMLVDPDSEVARIRWQREAQRGQIHGQNVTLGRLAAAGATNLGVIDPDTQPYRVLSGLVDATVQFVDPSAMALGGSGKGLEARTLFTAGTEVAEEAAQHPAVSTDILRSLASRFEVSGRTAMGRDELIQTLSGRSAALDALNGRELRNVASVFNVAGRSRMPKTELLDTLKSRFSNLGEMITEPAPPGQILKPTSAPAAAALGVAEQLRTSTRFTGVPQLAERTGLIKGSFLRHVHGPTAEAWLTGSEGRRVVDRIANETSAMVIDRATGNRLHPAEIRALRDAATSDQVAQVLKPMLGRSFRTTKDVWNDLGDSLPLVRTMSDTRALSDVPGASIDMADPRSAIDETVAWLRSAHVDDETTAHFVDRLVEAQNYDETFQVVEDAMTHTDGVLARAGVGSASQRAELVRVYRKEAAEAQAGFLAEVTAQGQLFDDIDVGGVIHPVGSPHQWTEHANRFIYLPDFRAVRRLTSSMPNLAWNAEGQLRKAPEMLLALQEDIWKPFTLLRGAWPIRVIGEEQLRMAASGKVSMFSDPLSYIAWATSRKSDALGDPFQHADEFVSSQTQRTNGFLNERPGRVRTSPQKPLARADDGFDDSWAGALVELHLDPVTRKLAESDSIDEVEEWLLNGEGRAHFDRMVTEHPEAFQNVNRIAQPQANGEIGLRTNTRVGTEPVRQYLENAAAWNDYLTGGNADLLDAVATGRLGRHSLLNPDGVTMNSWFTRSVKRSYADAAPESVMSSGLVAEGGPRSAVVERAFSWLMGKPTNYLSRSPVFRQHYWQRMEELIGYGTEEAKDALLAQAKSTSRRLGGERLGIDITEAPKEAIKRMEMVPAVGRLNLGEMDMYAKADALAETRRLLYDLSKKSQVADSMRLVSPFAEAWREVVTRWASLANPLKPSGLKNIRRAAQVLQGARGADFGEVMGAPTDLEGNQKGFFWKDEFGEEVFIYPGSQWLTGTVTDAIGPKVPVPLLGTTQGLSMFGQVIPGVGPAAAIPVSWLLADEPGFRRDLREVILPFGAPGDTGGAVVTQMLTYAPSWMKRGAQAILGGGYDADTNRLYANTVMSTANYLYSTGKYDTSSRQGQSQLLADARSAARTLTAVRAFAAFGAPSAPQLDFLVKADEKLLRFAWLRDDYYRLLDEKGFEGADEAFLDRWGDGVGLTMQAMTREVTGGIEPTREFDDWAQSHGSLRTDFPAIWAFFGPTGGDFDYNVYTRQIRQGHREALTPEEWLMLGMNHLGQMMQDSLLQQLGPEDQWTDEDRDFKREIEARIRDEYPGYNDFTGLEQRADRDEIFAQIDEAVQDDRIAETETGQGLRLYWLAREKVLDYAKEQGYQGIDRADDLEEDRVWLYTIGSAIAQEYPNFAPLWDRHLRQEVEPEREVG